MATGYSNVWTNGWASLRIAYATAYDPSTNSSTVTVTPQLKSAYNYGTDYRLYDAIYNGSAGVYGNGAKLFSLGPNSGSTFLSCGSCHGGWASFNRSFSFTVAHDSRGEASFTVGVLGSVRHYYGGGALVSPIGAAASAAITIRENAASSVVSSARSAATQSVYSLTAERALPTNRHVAVFRCGGDTLYTSEPFESSLLVTIPRSWFADYPTLAALPVTVSVQTYTDSGTALGSPATVSLTVTADAGMTPSVSAGWAALTAYNTGAVSGISGYVKGFSRAEAAFDPSKIDMTNAVGASIASFSVACQGVSVGSSPYRTPVLSAASVSVACTVTDSRGRSASETFPLTAADYAAPVITGQTVFRCGADGTADEDGAYISVKALVAFSSLDGQNRCALSAAVAAAGGAYGAENALTSGAASVLGPVSADRSYTVRFTASDSLGSASVYYVSVPTRKWAMKFRPNGSGVAFGKAPEADGVFEIADGWAVKSRGIVDLIYPVGSLYLSVDSASPAALFGGTWERIEDRFLLAAGTAYAAGSTGGETEHTLTKAELPNEKLDIHISNNWLGYKNTTAGAGSGIAGLGYKDGTALKTSSMGSGSAHNNMPPYLAVNIWKRTA